MLRQRVQQTIQAGRFRQNAENGSSHIICLTNSKVGATRFGAGTLPVPVRAKSL